MGYCGISAVVRSKLHLIPEAHLDFTVSSFTPILCPVISLLLLHLFLVFVKIYNQAWFVAENSLISNVRKREFGRSKFRDQLKYYAGRKKFGQKI